MDLHTTSTAIVDFIRANEMWAAPIVFLLAFGECLAFVSLLLPATIILVAIGGLLGASGIDIWPVWVAGAAGSTLGYAASYWLGVYYKDHIHTLWPFSGNPAMVQKGQAFFDRFGALGVFLGHFVGPLRAVMPVIAGMCMMRQLPFQVANIAASTLWTTGTILPGAFGMEWLLATDSAR